MHESIWSLSGAYIASVRDCLVTWLLSRSIVQHWRAVAIELRFPAEMPWAVKVPCLDLYAQTKIETKNWWWLQFCHLCYWAARTTFHQCWGGKGFRTPSAAGSSTTRSLSQWWYRGRSSGVTFEWHIFKGHLYSLDSETCNSELKRCDESVCSNCLLRSSKKLEIWSWFQGVVGITRFFW